MKLQEMQVLVRVGETGSMSTAARQLHLTPAAVSATIKRVEERLGIRLFERTTRTLHATDAGQAVLDGCRSILSEWSRTLEAIRGEDAELAGTVVISSPADTAYTIVQPLVAELSARHPGLHVVVDVSDGIQHLHRAAIDLAIRYGRLPDSSLTARLLARSHPILVAAPDYLQHHPPLRTPSDLVHHRCLTLRLAGVPTTTWSLHTDAGRVDVHLRRTLCGDGYLVKRWARAGRGIAWKAHLDVIDDLESGRLVQVLPAATGVKKAIHAVFPSRNFQPARVRTVAALLQAAFAERQQRCRAYLERSTGG